MGPLPPDDAYSILSPEPEPRVEAARWAHQARTFLDAEVVVGDGYLDVARAGHAPTRVPFASVPAADASDVLAAAERGVRAIGGAGFDVLVARCRRVWQLPRAVDGDPRAPLVAAALLASVLLGPIVPPDEETIYGVRGARVRLEKLGWPQSAA